MSEVFYMKNLIPNGEGALTVHRFAKNTEEGAKVLRDTLLAAGDWQDADQADWDNFQSAVPAVASVILNEEWIKIEHLPEEKRKAVRRFVAGETPAIEENETPEAGASEDADAPTA